MNMSGTLKINARKRSHNRAHRPGNPLSTYLRSVVKSLMEINFRSEKASSGTAQAYRLGDAVQHSGFGTGRVMAHWPDGTLLVRFDRDVKSQLVWPSLLDRANSRLR
jgi:hypothetical protein